MDVLRLIFGILLFLTASLAVLRAPTHLLWKVAIGATEWGHALALICIGVSALVWNDSWVGRASTGLCVAAAAIALTPAFRAMRTAQRLPRQIDKAFGKTPPSAPPLSLAKLFRGVSPPAIQPEKFIYKTAESVPLSLDFYRAHSPSPAPLVVVIHGGSWNSGDNTQFVPMDQYLAGRGFAVADIIYRLAPRFPSPAASEDVLSAIEFLSERAEQLNVDPSRIVLLGRSAGGQIALHVAYSVADPRIRGVISFYAPTDLHWSWDHPGNPRVIDTRAVLTDYLGGGPDARETAQKYDAGSPIRLVRQTSPPTLVLHGSRDELVSTYHSKLICGRLSEMGVPNLNLTLPWATHGFDYILRGPGGQISTYAVETFLNSVF